MKLSVVIPAHNEASSIAECVTSTTAALTGAGIDYEILVIDDASTDGTSAVVESSRNPTSGSTATAPTTAAGSASRSGPASTASRATPWRS